MQLGKKFVRSVNRTGHNGWEKGNKSGKSDEISVGFNFPAVYFNYLTYHFKCKEAYSNWHDDIE
jgi:hypothetical protein